MRLPALIEIAVEHRHELVPIFVRRKQPKTPPFRRDTLTASGKSNAGDPPRLTALIGSDLETAFGFLRYTQFKYTGELCVERDLDTLLALHAAANRLKRFQNGSASWSPTFSLTVFLKTAESTSLDFHETYPA